MSGVSLLQSEAVCNRKQAGGAVNPEINVDCDENQQDEQLLDIELFLKKPKKNRASCSQNCTGGYVTAAFFV